MDLPLFLLFVAPFLAAGLGLWLLLTRRALAALGVGACLLLAAAVSLYALDYVNLPFTKVAYAVQAGIIAEIVMGLACVGCAVRWLRHGG